MVDFYKDYVAKMFSIEGRTAIVTGATGALDILAVSHGYNKPQNILDQSVEDWQYIMDADLKSVYMIVKYAGEQMTRQGRGSSVTS
uniref:SDR family oxidoreductase n=1 Tax=Enterocloster clostridioformis TaxID=1531 RepID=UPI00080C83C6|nr:SDR family oxidoreductase [Enterocloster clostridioformis]